MTLDISASSFGSGRHVQIQEFTSGGSRSVRQKSSDNGFFSPQLILQKSYGQFQTNLSFFKVPEGVQLFPGGGGGPIAYSL